MTKSAIIAGIGSIVLGGWIFFKIFVSEAPIWVYIYPLIIIGIGIAMILLRKKEDKIEKRKD